MKKYKLFIQPEKLKEFFSDPWMDEKLDAVLILDNKKYKVQISFRGHHIRDHRKKSYDIEFLGQPFQENIRKIHINAEYNDPSLIRNKLSMDFFNDIGVFAPLCEHILLYINGVFKGVYLQLESFDETSLARRQLPQGPVYYATNDDANFSLLAAEGKPKLTLMDGYTRKAGTDADDEYLMDLLLKINTLSNEEFRKEITKHLNIEQYLRWLAGAVCTNNLDGFDHNYALYRNGKTGLFEISPWDYDAAWGRDIHGKPLDSSYVPIEGFNTLTARLLYLNDVKDQYFTTLTRIIENEFSVEYQLPIIETYMARIRPFIKEDPFIKDRIETFDGEIEYITEFIDERKKYLKKQILSKSSN